MVWLNEMIHLSLKISQKLHFKTKRDISYNLLFLSWVVSLFPIFFFCQKKNIYFSGEIFQIEKEHREEERERRVIWNGIIFTIILSLSTIIRLKPNGFYTLITTFVLFFSSWKHRSELSTEATREVQTLNHHMHMHTPHCTAHWQNACEISECT